MTCRNASGGKTVQRWNEKTLELPYFNDCVYVTPNGIFTADGEAVTRWEQVFLYNHMAQGGSALPTGQWKSLKEFPNTVSKLVSMRDHVETPLIQRFAGDVETLRQRALSLGATDRTEAYDTADVAVFFQVLPRVPVMLVFWDGEPEEGFDAEVKLLFDETIARHLDIESIMFLSERLCEMLCE